MKKYYIFSEMFGYYSYSIYIFEAKNFREACKKLLQKGKNIKIRDFNYDPKQDINKFNYLNDCGNKKKFKGFDIEWYDQKKKISNIFVKSWVENHPIFKLSYKELLKRDNQKREGISKKKYLQTNEEGWFDWIEVYGDLPKNYSFIDGHDG